MKRAHWVAAAPHTHSVHTAAQCVCGVRNVCVGTLRADQDQRQVGGVPVVGEAAEVVIDGLEADLVFQTEDEDHGVHPQCKLKRDRHTGRLKSDTWSLVGTNPNKPTR